MYGGATHGRLIAAGKTTLQLQQQQQPQRRHRASLAAGNLLSRLSLQPLAVDLNGRQCIGTGDVQEFSQMLKKASNY